jgi:hypothetical protein
VIVQSIVSIDDHDVPLNVNSIHVIVIKFVSGNRNPLGSLNSFFTMSFLLSHVTELINFCFTKAISSSVTNHHFLVIHHMNSFVADAYTAHKIVLCERFLITSLVHTAIFHLSHTIFHDSSLSIDVACIDVREGFLRLPGGKINASSAVNVNQSLV